MHRTDKIKNFIKKQVVNNPSNIVAMTASHFSVSRTTVLRHMQTLIDQGEIIKTGTTKQVCYTHPNTLNRLFTFDLNNTFDESIIFNQYLKKPITKYSSKACLDLCECTVTKILNNAKDHSKGKIVKLAFEIDEKNIHLSCHDNGTGVFKNLQQHFDFPDARTTLLELSKGKLTSDPVNHTGEGLFFSARAMDIFTLSANGFTFLRDNTVTDWTLFEEKTEPGTKLKMSIARNTSRSLNELFIEYQDDDSFAFSKTEVHIALAQEHGQRLISRSQAKRVVSNLEKFNVVTLDFKHVSLVGQGFVDQVFCVFQNANPAIQLNCINTNDDVAFMIKRSLNH